MQIFFERHQIFNHFATPHSVTIPPVGVDASYFLQYEMLLDIDYDRKFGKRHMYYMPRQEDSVTGYVFASEFEIIADHSLLRKKSDS